MSDWTETHRAVVHPWNCDVLGHMNVRWYAHLFDDAEFHLWSVIGLSHATLKKSGVVTVIAARYVLTIYVTIHKRRLVTISVVVESFIRLTIAVVISLIVADFGLWT